MSAPHRRSSSRQNWRTPLWLFHALTGSCKIDMDVAADCENTLSPWYLDGTPGKNGLVEPWGDVNWCNPPFKAVAQFVTRAIDEAALGRSTILLTTGSTETRWFHEAFTAAHGVLLITGRVSFIDPSTLQCVPGNPAGSAVFYIGRNVGAAAWGLCAPMALVAEERRALQGSRTTRVQIAHRDDLRALGCLIMAKGGASL